MKLQLVKQEKILFFLFAVLNLLPVLMVKYVASLDGPQHLYVSNLIGHLWRNDELYRLFFEFNPFIIGNCSGNILLAAFNLFMVDWMAEKAFIILYLFGMAYAFRYLVNSLSTKPSLVSYLIFPFSYTYLFMLGYYNFSVAIAVMMWAFGYWIRMKDQISLLRIFILTILLLLLYYSHVFVFMLFLMALGIYFLFTSVNCFLGVGSAGKKILIILKQAIVLLFAAMPAIIIGYIYLSGSAGSGHAEYLKLRELWENLYNMRMLVVFVPKEEYAFTHYYFILFCVLIGLQFIIRVIRIFRARRNDKPGPGFFQKNDFWLLLVVIFLALYFIFPDRLSAGNIAARIVTMMVMFLITWLALQDFPKLIHFLTLAFIVYLSFNIYKIHNKYQADANRIIREVKQVEAQLDPGTVFLSANYSSNWLCYHFQSYLGSESNIIDILSGGCSDQFFVNWNMKKRPFAFIGCADAGAVTHVYYNSSSSDTTIKVDYIVVLGNHTYSVADSNDRLYHVIDQSFNLVYKSSKGFASLYKFSRNEEYADIEKRFHNNPAVRENFSRKSKKSGVRVDEVFRREALWALCNKP